MTATWLISGASSGFGRELALEAASHGAMVIAAARRKERLDQLRDEAPVGLIHPMRLDVTSAQAIHHVVDSTIGQYGAIDVLVNCAGAGLVGAAEETSETELRQQMEVNFFGMVELTRAVLPHMRQRRSGTLIQFSSGAGIVGLAGSSAYCASKFALEGYCEALAEEVRPLGIHVVIVEPGGFRTDFSGSALREAENVIPDYAQTAGKRRDFVKSVDGVQLGDPRRAATAIIQAISADDPPLHLVLGSDALRLAQEKLARTQAALQRWEALSRSTDIH
jgi:NAD(P)-dependent dehydrogenase (short-subunit alcohol dehydrogenase family)